MTIEIRELVIQAAVAPAAGEVALMPGRSVAQEKTDEARWIEIIAQHVLQKLREEEGWQL